MGSKKKRRAGEGRQWALWTMESAEAIWRSGLRRRLDHDGRTHAEAQVLSAPRGLLVGALGH